MGAPIRFDPSTFVEWYRQETQRTAESRFHHRLHALLLVSIGHNVNDVAQWLGDNPRTVTRWMRRFQQQGPEGLWEGKRPGRPNKLSREQMDELRQTMKSNGNDEWNGPQLAEFIHEHFDVDLSVRQCQRLLRRLHATAGKAGTSQVTV
ncbi:MAG: helix-turn-helix domain containing protein [Chromatiales bacterium]|nr:helix-turn-helix domain containing protein [Chromatiales bacterium]